MKTIPALIDSGLAIEQRFPLRENRNGTTGIPQATWAIAPPSTPHEDASFYLLVPGPSTPPAAPQTGGIEDEGPALVISGIRIQERS